MDLDLIILIIIILLASKSLSIRYKLPAAATLRLGKVIKAITVPTRQKAPNDHTCSVSAAISRLIRGVFCKENRRIGPVLNLAAKQLLSIESRHHKSTAVQALNVSFLSIYSTGAGGSTRSMRPMALKKRPFRTTPTTFRRSATCCSGSPSTMTRSARLPGAIRPRCSPKLR